MSLWNHSENLLASDLGNLDRVSWFYVHVRSTKACKFCRRSLTAVRDKYRTDDLGDEYPRFRGRSYRGRHSSNTERLFDEQNSRPPEVVESRVKVCRLCGWWVAFEETLQTDNHRAIVRSYGGAGALKNLDLRDVSTPIEEIRAYLIGRYEARFALHPNLFEQTVASVFGDLGYRARATGQSGDGGVDVILWAPDGSEIGVQVKRYRGTIQVSQIRELTGTLVQKGITKGIFVTTSRFAKGVRASADLSSFRGHPIELVDANGFLERLEIAQETAGGRSLREYAPWERALLQIHERSRRRFT
jgi:restriction system protein